MSVEINDYKKIMLGDYAIISPNFQHSSVFIQFANRSYPYGNGDYLQISKQELAQLIAALQAMHDKMEE